MNVLRASIVLVVVGLAFGAGLACSSGGDDDDDTADDDSGSSSQSDPTGTPAKATSTKATAKATATPDDTGKAPVFKAGLWTGGEATATISGTVAFTVTGTLKNDSDSKGQTTHLIYVNGIHTIAISISREYQPFAIQTNTDRDRGESKFGVPCEVTYASATDSRIEGTFKCAQIEAWQVGGQTSTDSSMEGTFVATR
ncbi:MAG: hypothetical protein AB7J35_18930 [Dehalococcoidia bacterium]